MTNYITFMSFHKIITFPDLIIVCGMSNVIKDFYVSILPFRNVLFDSAPVMPSFFCNSWKKTTQQSWIVNENCSWWSTNSSERQNESTVSMSQTKNWEYVTALIYICQFNVSRAGFTLFQQQRFGYVIIMQHVVNFPCIKSSLRSVPSEQYCNDH